MQKSLLKFSLISSLLVTQSTAWAESKQNTPSFDFDQLEVIYPENYEKSSAISSNDPYESFNRSMLEFNLSFHDSVGRPVIEGYRMIPSPVRTAGENFLNNLGQPLSMINSFLQGNTEDGLSTLMRFSMNSTLGLLGVIDIATEAGLEDKDEDFGQTLYVWGVWNDANYVVLPFLGPTTTRDIFGKVEGSVDPIYYQNGLKSTYGMGNEFKDKAKIFAANGIAGYNQAEPLISTLKNQIDPYLFSREAYIQNRVNAIYNGKPPMPKIADDFFE